MKVLWVAVSLVISQAALADGSYSVPVPPELAAQASFELPSAKWIQAQGQRTLSYVLPADLVGGKGIEISLSGAAPELGDGLVPFTGELASGGCTLLSESKALCMVQYKLKTFGADPARFSEEASEYLKSKYAGSLELPNRLAIQALFQNEPAGVVSLEIQ